MQALIDAALAPVLAQLAEAVLFGASVAVQASGGKFLCAEQGGPAVDRQAFELTARSDIGIWESWIVSRGQS